MGVSRILLVDHEPAGLMLMSRTLTRSGYAVFPASNARRALQLVNASAPIDLVACSVAVADAERRVLLGAARQASSSTALMLISQGPPPPGLPADAFILQKPFLPRDLIAAVRRTLAASARLGGEVASACQRARELRAESVRILAESAAATLDPRRMPKWQEDRVARRTPQSLRPACVLSPREIEVLELLASGLRTKQIASALGVSYATVAAHHSRILAKLNVRETVLAIRWAIREGLIEP